MNINPKQMTISLTAAVLIAALAASASGSPFQGCCAPAKTKDGKAQAPKATAATVKDGVQRAIVTVDGGYSPASISVKAGIPVELTFKLGKNPGCGAAVVFPSLKIKQQIAAGKGSVIKFTPKKSGDIAFECSMGMYKGKISVK